MQLLPIMSIWIHTSHLLYSYLVRTKRDEQLVMDTHTRNLGCSTPSQSQSESALFCGSSGLAKSLMRKLFQCQLLTVPLFA